MTKRLRFLMAYMFSWVLYFCIFKGIFLIYNSELTSQMPCNLIFAVFSHGLRLDLSCASYLCVFPFLMTALSVIISERVVKSSILFYTMISLGFVTFLCVVDLGLFTAWGFRLDGTPLMYINTPKEMLASAMASPIYTLFSILLVVLLSAGYLYKKKIQTLLHDLPQVRRINLLLFILLTALLIIPIRGGFQLAPINASHAYFSTNDFANQAAINVPWNFFYLINETYDKTGPYRYLDEKKAEGIVKGLYRTSEERIRASVLKVNRPNIIIILWESLTAKAVPSLGGFSGVTPRFDQLEREGILFSNFYANADRSEKSLVAVLSAYPPQPRQSIIKTERKTAKLPALSKSFNGLGYTTSFYYGGELEFAHIKSYLLNCKFDTITGKDAFDPKDCNSKWGVHDHILLEKVLNDLDHQAEPFFTTVFTLSSHEPFEVPVPTVISGDDIESRFLNSLHYTDMAIGSFVENAKAKPWYANTLIIITADHGSAYPGHSHRYEQRKFHVPMLWLGGALTVQNKVIDKICSQTDLAATLLGQMCLDAHEYPWSKNILDPQALGFAQYVFNDGMGYVNERGGLAFDNNDKHCIYMDSTLSDKDLEISKALLQVSYRDFLKK